MKAIEVQLYKETELTTIIISSIKFIQDDIEGQERNAVIYYLDGTTHTLRITRDQVTDLINRR